MTGPRGAAPWGTPPGALPLDPTKGLCPLETHQRALPSGLLRRAFGPLDTQAGGLELGFSPCRGHGARRARRDAETVACRCCGGEGSASADAGRGLCDRPLHSFAAPLSVVFVGKMLHFCQLHLPQPSSEGAAKVSKGRPQSPLGSEAFVASGDKEKAERVSRNERPLAATIESADAARRRETSSYSKGIVLSKNSIIFRSTAWQ